MKKKNKLTKQTKDSGKQHLGTQAKIESSYLANAVIGLIIAGIILLGFELCLRITGTAQPRISQDRFIGFHEQYPLFTVKDGVAVTASEKQKFFNKESFAVQKPANTYRIFVFGGSTTYGHPFDGASAFPRWLGELLKISEPNQEFEVINAGGISYASYRIVPLIKETLSYQPNLMIVYTGHNEFLESRTYGNLKNRNNFIVTLEGYLEQLHTYELLKGLINRLLTTQNTPQTPKSGGQLSPEVETILDRSAGLNLYHRDDKFTRDVVEHFESNLQQIIDLCKKSGIPVIICEPASNLRDFSPFKSEPASELSREQKEFIHKVFLEAETELEKGNIQKAWEHLQNVLNVDPRHAGGLYAMGRCLNDLGRHDEARNAFMDAKDNDIAPLRCVTEIEKRIRQIAERNNVPLIPYKSALERIAKQQGDQSGSPGNESFLDHVHPTIEKHQLLSELILETMIKNKFVSPASPPKRSDIDQMYQTISASFDKQFMLTRDLNLVKTLNWAGKKQEARQILSRISGDLQDNPEIHKILGSYYLEEGEFSKALNEYETAVMLSGNDPEMLYSLATAYYRSGKKGKAVETYEKVISSDKFVSDAYANYAMLLLESGKGGQARDLLNSALQISPESKNLYAPLALSLAIAGELHQALSWMQKAIKAEPGNPDIYYNLAGIYALLGDKQNALSHLTTAVAKGYNKSEQMQTDQVFASIRQTPEFRRIVQQITR